MIRPLTIAACFALTSVAALTAANAAAQDAGTTPAAPAAAPADPQRNAERGRQLTYTCQGCHGVTGYRNAYPNYRVPRIGGQSTQYLVNALTDYRTGSRKHPTMQAQSQSFSDQDIADIAAYLSADQ